MLRFFVKNASRLRQDDGGQAILFVAVLGLVLVLFAAAVINIGNLASNRIKMQGAADAAAFTAGTWMARGLNLISAMNVAMTQALALIVIMESMEEMKNAAEIGKEIQIATGEALQSNPWTAAIGVVLVTLANTVGTASVEVLKTAANVADEVTNTLWKIMEGLSTAEGIIAKAVPFVAVAHAEVVAMQNGADFVVPFPLIPWPTPETGGLYFALPVEEGKFTDLCRPTRDGGEGFKLRYQSEMNIVERDDMPTRLPTDPKKRPRRWSSHWDDRGDPVTEGGVGYLTQYHNQLRPVFAAMSLGTMGATSIAWEVIPWYKFYDLCGETLGASASPRTQDVQIGSCEVCRGRARGPDGRFHPEAWDLTWNVYLLENQIPNQPSFNTQLTGGDTGAISKDDIRDFQAGGTPDSGGSPRPVDPNVKLLWSREEGGSKYSSCDNGPNGELYSSHRTEWVGPDEHSSESHQHTYYRRIVRRFSTCMIRMQYTSSGMSYAPSESDRPKPWMLKVEPKERMKNFRGQEEDVDFYKKHLDISMFAVAGEDKVKGVILTHQFTDPYSGESRQVFKSPDVLGISMLTYGQAHVFNQRSEDLFTQDWKVTLAKFDMHERFGGDFLGSEMMGRLGGGRGVSGFLGDIFGEGDFFILH